jgi:hypothetical protein
MRIKFTPEVVRLIAIICSPVKIEKIQKPLRMKIKLKPKERYQYIPK